MRQKEKKKKKEDTGIPIVGPWVNSPAVSVVSPVHPCPDTVAALAWIPCLATSLCDGGKGQKKKKKKKYIHIPLYQRALHFQWLELECELVYISSLVPRIFLLFYRN